MDAYQNLFWYVWRDHMPGLEQSIIKCAIGRYRYRGDVQDVVQEVLLSAYEKWYSYDEDRAGFTTWVLELTKQYLANLYNTKGVGMGPGRGNRAVPEYTTVRLPAFVRLNNNGESVPLSEVIPSNSPTPEEVIVADEEWVQICTTVHELFLANRNTRKGQILEAMAALIDDELKPTTRLIAKMVGCSHSTVASELKEIRKWLLGNS